MTPIIHLVNCRNYHQPSEDGWLVVGADSSFTAAIKALDYYWPKWTNAQVGVTSSNYEVFEFLCEKQENGDVVFEIPMDL